MKAALIRHPDFPCEAAASIEVEVERSTAGVLTLTYRTRGVTQALVVPEAAPPERTDELWKTTCFEAFIERAHEAGYYELNLSPSSRWAAYRFDGYRQGMRAAAEIAAPQIRLERQAGELALAARIDLAETDAPAHEPWRLAITAVIEEAGGRTSYWALAHAPKRPDFHHPDGFVLELPVTERP